MGIGIPNYLNPHNIDPSHISPCGNDSLTDNRCLETECSHILNGNNYQGEQVAGGGAMTREEAALVFEDTSASDAVVTDDWYGTHFAKEFADACNTAISALRGPAWIKTSERLPTVLDADDEGRVPILTSGMLTGGWIMITAFYKAVTTETAEYFLPLPKPPEVDE